MLGSTNMVEESPQKARYHSCCPVEMLRNRRQPCYSHAVASHPELVLVRSNTAKLSVGFHSTVDMAVEIL